MRDFPMFTTEYGIASLILKEVPYREEAYIILQSTEQPEQLLEECISFCRMVGAEKIFVRGHAIAETYPHYCSIYEMRGQIPLNEAKVEHLWPVTKETVGQWREFLNSQLRQIDNAGTLDGKMEQEILNCGDAYFIHRSGEMLGAGWIVDGELKLIAAREKGMGQRVLHTLLSVSEPEQIRLEVASTNIRAIRFYEKMGLVKTAELRSWYLVR